jgi:hypothetical protein
LAHISGHFGRKSFARACFWSTGINNASHAEVEICDLQMLWLLVKAVRDFIASLLAQFPG